MSCSLSSCPNLRFYGSHFSLLKGKWARQSTCMGTLQEDREACKSRRGGGPQPGPLRHRLSPTPPPIAIDINSSDIKALYRRCQALEHLGKLDQAFKDVQRCATLEPRNQNFQETLRRLNGSIQEKVSWAAPHRPWLCPFPIPVGMVGEQSQPYLHTLAGGSRWQEQAPQDS